MPIISHKKWKIIPIFFLVILLLFLFFIFLSQEAKAPIKKVLGALEPVSPTSSSPSSLNASENGNILTDNKESIELLFGGDIMLSRVVDQKMAKYQDYDWPLKKLSGLMSGADLTAVNLESPFTYGKNHLVLTGSFSFNADPKSVSTLKSAGVDLVSLANNHFANQGEKGMRDTFSVLKNNGIKYAGAGNNSQEAYRGEVIEVRNKKIGFLAFAYPNDSSIAGDKSPGMVNMDLVKAKKAIEVMKNEADFVVVMMHAGIEYVNKPNEQQKQFARMSIDSGADLVIGHHPHWVQTTEIYKAKPIIYSLGNLVFDQMWSRETAQGALADVKLEPLNENLKVKEIKIIPIKISDFGQAALATSTSEKQEILKRMGLNKELIEF